ncbi:hypothetical protein ACLOJK_039191 [Asimina triloba]
MNPAASDHHLASIPTQGRYDSMKPEAAGISPIRVADLHPITTAPFDPSPPHLLHGLAVGILPQSASSIVPPKPKSGNGNHANSAAVDQLRGVPPKPEPIQGSVSISSAYGQQY